MKKKNNYKDCEYFKLIKTIGTGELDKYYCGHEENMESECEYASCPLDYKAKVFLEVKQMEEMKVIVKWEGDPFWMNPDNLLLVLREKCPNTKFECEYLIHPNDDKKESESNGNKSKY